MKIEYTYTPEDYAELSSLAQKAPKVRRRVFVVRLLTVALILAVCVIPLGQMMFLMENSYSTAIYIVMVVVITAGVVMGVRRSKKGLSDNVRLIASQGRMPPGFFGPRTLELGEMGVTVSYAEQSFTLPYHDLEGTAEYNGGLALCKTDILWDLIPAAAFQSESDRTALVAELERRKAGAVEQLPTADFPQPPEDAQLVLHFVWTKDELERFDAAARREDTATWRFWRSQLWLTLFSVLAIVGMVASVRLALAGEVESLFYMILRPVIFLGCNVRLLITWTPLNRIYSRWKIHTGVLGRILAGSITLSLTPQGFHSTTALGNDFTTWGQTKGVRRSVGGLLILTYKYMRYPIPLSAFSSAEQADEVKAMIRNYVGQRWGRGQ